MGLEASKLYLRNIASQKFDEIFVLIDEKKSIEIESEIKSLKDINNRILSYQNDFGATLLMFAIFNGRFFFTKLLRNF